MACRRKLQIRRWYVSRKTIRENAPELDLNVKVTTPSNEEIGARIAFGVEFFRPFYGI